MDSNDCLRRLRYILDLNDNRMIKLFAEGGQTVTRSEVSAWLKKDGDEDLEVISDKLFAQFLNGLITYKRGKSTRPSPEPEQRLTNNIIFRKLKIALDLEAEEILGILALADFRISKHELSAFFRKVGNRHYRKCKDQVLRNFLKGLQIQRYDASSAGNEENLD